MSKKKLRTKQDRLNALVVCTRLHEVEIAYIQKLLKETGMSESVLIRAFIRMAMFELNAPGKDYNETILNLHKIGSSKLTVEKTK